MVRSQSTLQRQPRRQIKKKNTRYITHFKHFLIFYLASWDFNFKISIDVPKNTVLYAKGYIFISSLKLGQHCLPDSGNFISCTVFDRPF
jgi:hypothetical protein